jgi:hypothetical protein
MKTIIIGTLFGCGNSVIAAVVFLYFSCNLDGRLFGVFLRHVFVHFAICDGSNFWAF